MKTRAMTARIALEAILFLLLLSVHHMPVRYAPMPRRTVIAVRSTVVQLNVTVVMSLLVCFGNHVVVVEVGEVFVVVLDSEEVFLLPKEN